MTLGKLAIWLHKEMEANTAEYNATGRDRFDGMAEAYDLTLDHVVPMLEGPEQASYETFLQQRATK